jgi:hypothetical protein
MALRVTVHGSGGRPARFERGPVVRVGRSAANDVCVADARVDGRWTVSAVHLETAWDGALLEREVLLASYGAFAALPRPARLEPCSHAAVAHHLGRSSDSARRAIERTNDKIGRADDPPPAATGRNVSPEIGRWLARVGALDPPGQAGATSSE